jgi:hypothetical protein
LKSATPIRKTDLDGFYALSASANKIDGATQRAVIAPRRAELRRPEVTVVDVAPLFAETLCNSCPAAADTWRFVAFSVSFPL